jgi:hypothetical protein
VGEYVRGFSTGRIRREVWGVGGRGVGAHSAEFANYRLLGRDSVYSGTELTDVSGNLLALFCLIDIYRPSEARSVSYIRCHQHVNGAVRGSGGYLRLKT